MKIRLLLVLIISLVSTACQRGGDANSAMVGDWKVQWVTSPEQGQDAIPGMNYTMNGQMIIEANGQLTIKAYGYENCIFQRDTVENTLDWYVSADTLFMRNEGDEFDGIPYVIKESSANKIKLQLVQDIYLFLTK